MIILVTIVFFPANYMLLKVTENSGWQEYDNWNSYRHQLQNRVSQNFILENIDKIVAYCDGLMVARGDLGVEIPAHEVPLIQKKLIKSTSKAPESVLRQIAADAQIVAGKAL